MVINLKLRFSKVIQTFQSCRSKDPSNFPSNPIPSSHKCHVSSSPNPGTHLLSPLESPRHKIYNSSASEYDAAESSWLFFSSETEEERESDGLMFASRKFKKKTKRAVRKERGKVRLTWRSSVSSEEGETPKRLSVFLKLMPCSVEGKVKESFAVVKKSEDPYEDFKRSMVEMILEKQMFEDRELEQLLHCFLSLNSRQYHGLIIQVFTEIWKAMFCKYSTQL